MSTTPESVEEPPPGKHRRPPSLSLELSGEAECPDCWTPENVESPTTKGDRMSDQEIEELADNLLKLATEMAASMRAARGLPPIEDDEMTARRRRDVIQALKRDMIQALKEELQ